MPLLLTIQWCLWFSLQLQKSLLIPTTIAEITTNSCTTTIPRIITCTFTFFSSIRHFHYHWKSHYYLKITDTSLLCEKDYYCQDYYYISIWKTLLLQKSLLFQQPLLLIIQWWLWFSLLHVIPKSLLYQESLHLQSFQVSGIFTIIGKVTTI